MFEFLDRLITVALPRVRDFRGIPGKSFDGRGNFALGLKEQIVFPEIDYDRVDAVRGMNVVVVTTAKTDAEAKALLKGLRYAVCQLISGSSAKWRRKAQSKKTPDAAKLARRIAGKRSRLRAIAIDREAPPGRAVCGAAEARRAATQQL